MNFDVLTDECGRDVLIEHAREVELVERAEQGPPGPPGIKGDPGEQGASGLRVAGAVETRPELPASAAAGDLWVTRADGMGYAWANGAWALIGPVAMQGPPGERGRDGQIRFTGNGQPPTVIPGAQPGDTYLDVASGDVFKLV